MEGVSKCKVGAPASRRRPLADKFLYRKLVLVNAYKCAKFRLPGSISLRDKVVVLKLNVGATSPLPYPVRWKFYVCLKYFSRSNSVPNFSIVSLWIMQLCEYVFCIGFPLYVPKMGFLGVLRVKMWKDCLLTPKRHYPAWIRVCWCIACQNRFNGLSSRSVERFLRTKKEIKKWVVTLAIWEEVTPGATLTKCGLWGDMVDVITCAIFGDCRLKGVDCGCGERGKFAFSHWLHIDHTVTW